MRLQSQVGGNFAYFSKPRFRAATVQRRVYHGRAVKTNNGN
jgi:hypothetical protein